MSGKAVRAVLYLWNYALKKELDHAAGIYASDVEGYTLSISNDPRMSVLEWTYEWYY